MSKDTKQLWAYRNIGEVPIYLLAKETDPLTKGLMLLPGRHIALRVVKPCYIKTKQGEPRVEIAEGWDPWGS